MQACFFCRAALEVPLFYLAIAAATFWPCMEVHGIESGCLAHHLISCKTNAAKGTLASLLLSCGKGRAGAIGSGD